MKLTAIFLLAITLQVNASGFAQTVTISQKQASLQKIFKEINRQTGFTFFYEDEVLKQVGKVDIQVTNASIQQVLDICFKNQPLSYSIAGNSIVVKQKEKNPEPKNIATEELQNIEIRGTVTDEQGRPMPSVSATIPGTPLGAMTNQKGEYVIKGAPENAEIIFSYVGYVSQRFRINNKTVINVVLKQEDSRMEETVVIGYGTTTKRKNTGSVSTLTAEEIAKQPVANPLNALQGRVAGALVTQSNGLPGSRVTIQIRGVNTIDQTGAGTQPLYLVDGVPFNINDNSTPTTNDLNGRGSFAAAGGLSPFSVINPADIESISILKDADATAIYGTRGSNGVVLITTKKGKAGKTKLDVNAYTGKGKVGHFIPMMNTPQYLQMRKEAYANDGITPNAASAPDLLLWDQNAYTDFQKKYLGGTADISDAQATVSGGDQRTRFLLNAGYHYETPVFPGDYNDKRISSRLNVDHNSLDRKFNANVSVNYTYENTNLLARDLSTLYNLPPNMPLYNSDGSIYWDANFTNPESYLLVKYLGKTNSLMANTLLRYTILPGLDVKATFGFSKIQLDQNTQNPATSKNPLTTAVTNSASFANINQNSYILEPQITYTRNIAKGKFNALLGSTFHNSLNTSLRTSGDNYATPVLLGSITGAGTVGTPSYGYTQYRYTSIFGRVNYDWDSKYLINAVLRRDGSSRFGPDNKFGNFWSIGAGWIFTNENFAKDLSVLSFGKLRASYGLTGNDQIQDYMYRTFFTSSGTYQNSTALAPDKINNPDLHWQNTYKTEFGLELGFIKNRIALTANYYTNKTPDQLGFLNLSAQAGFNSYQSNFDAVIRNKGWEFELNTTNISTKDFKWTTSFNITIPKTILVSASPSYFFYNKSTIGQPLSSVFRFIYEGVDAKTGNPLYKNLTKDTLTFTPSFSTDRGVAGYTQPKYYGGLNNVLSYKGFDLSFFFQFTGQEGNIYPTTAPGVLSNGNQQTYWLDRWTTTGGKVGGTPRYTTTSSVYSSWSSSDAVWGNSSFLRLRTVNLSYSFPRELVSKWKMDNLRLYLQGQNLWWASKNKYVYDPETGTAMPPLRVITAGINVTL
ncbi:SusC/RagA family TonB-linked outer membrane protein [Pinibacter soli]|uniref:SusC/RagA family TonB-linked outer membrane protein n=1 Tax=Pinibacter soli TaxID=3044211 RepID=A0ABT6REU0_9BACT|nr:SusC/RagA family TonB-linked outer membrane protein [Pinibacter soli]MDI3320986.1 SusC/RagA family TonB-linked outer membrane protein [Pinibacter soli]